MWTNFAAEADNIGISKGLEETGGNFRHDIFENLIELSGTFGRENKYFYTGGECPHEELQAARRSIDVYGYRGKRGATVEAW